MLHVITRNRSLLYLNSKPYPLSPPFSLPFCTTNTSDSHSFAISYLINTFGFSPEFASKASSSYYLTFKSSEKPDSVLTFFQTRGLSASQIRDMVRKETWLLSSDPDKRLLPKFEFFLSKGISISDFAKFVSMNPRILRSSLDRQIIPSYELVYGFLQSHKETCDLVIQCPTSFTDSRVPINIRMLIENGVTETNLVRLIQRRFRVCSNPELRKVVEELKDLGFDPSKSTFVIALQAKVAVTKTGWSERVETYKKWGWSDEVILNTFRKYPHCMLASSDKINSMMSFWVNELGWDAILLAKAPHVFTANFERMVVPRAAVVQFLLKKGLRKKNASLSCPFALSEKSFLEKFINCHVEDSSDLLMLYQEKVKLAYAREKNTGL